MTLTPNPLSSADGFPISFRYRSSNTPTLREVEPPVAAPGDAITLKGDRQSWSLQLSSPEEVASIRVGPHVCSIADDTPGGELAAMGVSSGQYFVTCDLPGAPGPSNPGRQGRSNAPPAGVHDVVAVFNGRHSELGAAAIERGRGRSFWTLPGQPYVLAVAPVVESVSPSVGSLAGSTPLTIRGHGFPDSRDDGGLDGVVVTAGGKPCRPLRSTADEFVCLTSPLHDAPAPLAIDGFYPGGHGVLVDVFSTEEGEDGARLNDPDFAAIRASGGLRDEAASGPRPGAMSLAPDWDNYVARLRSFFVPPVDGDYVFVVSSDDNSELWVAARDDQAHDGWAWLGGDDEEEDAEGAPVAGVSSWTSRWQWDKEDGQRSDPIPLRAGEAVLLDLIYREGGGGDHGMVGVEIPVPDVHPASQPNVQRFSVEVDFFGAKLVFEARVPAADAGAGDDAEADAGAGVLPGVCLSNETFSAIPTHFPVDADKEAVKEAVEAWSGVKVESVGIEDVDVTGDDGAPLTVRRWTVEFDDDNWDLDDILPLTGSFDDPLCATVEVSATPHSEPLAGDLEVVLGEGDDAEVVSIPVDADEETVRLLLSRLRPLQSGAMRVSRGGNERTGYAWTVEFDALSFQADLPPLQARLGPNAQGEAARASASVRAVFNRAAFFAPIPPEFLRLPVDVPNAVDVVVRHAPALPCEDPLACVFEPAASATPALIAVDPATAAQGDRLTVTGTGFGDNPAAVRVTLGGAECVVEEEEFSDGAFTCVMGEGGAAGAFLLLVGVEGKGLATAAPNAASVVDLDILSANDFAPHAVSSGARVRLDLAGAGFDPDRCDALSVAVYPDGAPSEARACEVEACSSTTVACFLDTADMENGEYVVEITATGAESPLDPMEAFAARRLTAEWSETVAFDSPLTVDSLEAPGVVALGAPGNVRLTVEGAEELTKDGASALPGAPALFDVVLTGATAADVTGARLVPAPGSDPAAPVYDVTTSASAPESATVTLSVGATMPGPYWVEMDVLAQTVRSPAPLLSAIEVTSVSPPTGTLAGGTTLTIAGWGFAVAGASAAAHTSVVAVHVPVSTTFPSGIVLCDVVPEASSFDALTCVTRHHCAADASPEDPMAFRCEHTPTAPGAVEVVTCGAGKTELGNMNCWGRDETPRSSCAAEEGESCTFAYVEEGTAFVAGLETPALTFPSEATLVVLGTGLAPGTAGEPGMTVRVGGEECPLVVEGSSSTRLACSAPVMPPGRYPVEVAMADGQRAVMGARGAGVVVRAAISTVSDADALDSDSDGDGIGDGSEEAAAPLASSAAGGLRLRLSAEANSAPLADDTAVFVGALPCDVESLTVDEVVCAAPASLGVVLAAYYPLEWGVRDLVDLSAEPPALVETLPALDVNWRDDGPLVQKDYFAAVLSTHLEIVDAGAYHLVFECDDACEVSFDGAVVHRKGDDDPDLAASVFAADLVPGFYPIRVQLQEERGHARVRVRWARGEAGEDAAPLEAIPPNRLHLHRPGAPVPVSLTSAGIDGAVPATAAVVFDVATAPTAASVRYLAEADADSLAAALAATPDDVAAMDPERLAAHEAALALGASGGIADAAAMLFVAGSALLPASCTEASCDAPPVVTVGGHPCEVDVAVSSAHLLACSPPPLPAGSYPVSVRVPSSGFALGKPSAAFDVSVAAISPTEGSIRGGTVLEVTGFGFLGSFPVGGSHGHAGEHGQGNGGESSAGETVELEEGQRDAWVTISGHTCEIDWATATTTALRCKVAARNGQGAGAVRVRVGSAQGDGPIFSWTNDATPTVAEHPDKPFAVSPAAPSPLELLVGGGAISGESFDVLFVPVDARGALFGWGGEALPTVTVNVATLTETESGHVASFDSPLLPAGDYEVVILTPAGVSSPLALSVPLTVESVGRAVGSRAGGTVITIAGAGWADGDVEGVEVLLRGPMPGEGDEDAAVDVPCDVTAVTTTEVVCVTREAPAFGEYAMRLRPGALVALQDVVVGDAPFLFSVTEAATPLVSSVTPWRGTTEGGTVITIAGSGIAPSGTTTVKVFIGETECTDVQDEMVVVGAEAISCVTGDPTPLPRGKQAVTVHVEGLGNALAVASEGARVEYEYVDLWSRKSTWGG